MEGQAAPGPAERRRVSAVSRRAGTRRRFGGRRRLADCGLAATIGYMAAPRRAAARGGRRPPRRLRAPARREDHRLPGVGEAVGARLRPGAAGRARTRRRRARRGPCTSTRSRRRPSTPTWRLLEGAPRGGDVGIDPARPLAAQRRRRGRSCAGSGCACGSSRASGPTRPAADVDPAAGLPARRRPAPRPRRRGRRRDARRRPARRVAAAACSAAGTPCSAELFLGMPFRAPAAWLAGLGVPIRVYVAVWSRGAPYGVADVARQPGGGMVAASGPAAREGTRRGGASDGRTPMLLRRHRAGRRLDPVGQLRLRAAVVARRRRAGVMERGGGPPRRRGRRPPALRAPPRGSG